MASKGGFLRGRTEAMDSFHPQPPDKGVLSQGGQALRVAELALLQHRQHLRPDLAVLVARLRQEDEALDRDRDAERHDQHAGVDEQAAILKELE